MKKEMKKYIGFFAALLAVTMASCTNDDITFQEETVIEVNPSTVLKNFTFQYSPESFHGTEVEYALDVCNAVLDVWQPTEAKKAIINIPATVETAMPHVFAAQIEYISKNLNKTKFMFCKHIFLLKKSY